MHPQRPIPWTIILLPVVFAILWLLITRPAFAATAPGGPSPAATPQPALTTANATVAQVIVPPAYGGSADWHSYCPTSPADALGDPAFWMVMGLVVLGYLVVAADYRQSP